MRKEEFLDLLRYYLSRFPQAMVEDIVRDYEEHFAIGLENGRTEEQIVEELGSPREIAREYEQGDFMRVGKTARDESGPTSESEESLETEDTLRGRWQEFMADPGNRRLLVLLGLFLLVALILPPLFRFVGSVLSIVSIVFFAMLFGPLLLGLATGAIGAVLIGSVWRGASGAGFLFAGVQPITLVLFGAAFLLLGLWFISGTGEAMRTVWGWIQRGYYTIRWEINKRRRSE